jgi:hypothetical protein
MGQVGLFCLGVVEICLQPEENACLQPDRKPRPDAPNCYETSFKSASALAFI